MQGPVSTHTISATTQEAKSTDVRQVRNLHTPKSEHLQCRQIPLLTGKTVCRSQIQIFYKLRSGLKKGKGLTIDTAILYYVNERERGRDKGRKRGEADG